MGSGELAVSVSVAVGICITDGIDYRLWHLCAGRAIQVDGGAVVVHPFEGWELPAYLIIHVVWGIGWGAR